MQKNIAEYGPAVVDRVIVRDRVKTSLSIDASGGVDLWHHDQKSIHIQAAVVNLNNRLNVDFVGLFSGNAIAPPRSYSLHLAASF